MKIVFVGLNGVPYSNRAIDIRLGAFADLFVKCGYHVEIINRYSAKKIDIERSYVINNPFSNLATQSKLVSLMLYVASLFVEPFRILSSHRKEKIDVLFMSTGHFIDMIMYRMISWIIGAKLVNQYCEARSAFEIGGLYHKVNGYLVDNVSSKLWDGAVCISHYLKETSIKVNKKLKTTIVYPLCDFTSFDNCVDISSERYLMFCGSLEYEETIEFILESYRRSGLYGKIKLLMVLAGSNNKLGAFKNSNPDIEVESNLPYGVLIKRYKGAIALLIPLRDTIRDIARFPNKTCEYCAAKGVIVTTNVGEMPFVFKDMENAIMSDHYDVTEYANKLNWIMENLDNLSDIKERCYETGLSYFHRDAYQNKVENFFNQILLS